jgi:hypothetical protein
VWVSPKNVIVSDVDDGFKVKSNQWL